MLYKPYSAISSWYGYDYQGKIAIYMMLQKLSNLIIKNCSYSEYTLEIEHIEDFSIKDKTQYISIHQVKSGVKSSLDECDIYNFVMAIIDKRPMKAYYHFSSKIANSGGEVETTTEYIKKLIGIFELLAEFEEFDNDKVIEALELDKKKTPTGKTIVYGKAKKATVRDILFNTFASKGLLKNRTIENINDISAEIKSDLEKALIYLEENNENIIEIHGLRFANFQKIEEATCNLVKQIMKNLKIAWYKTVNKEYMECLYAELCSLLSSKISESKSNAAVCSISFEDVYNTISTDYSLKIDNLERQYYLMKSSIRKNYTQFPIGKSAGVRHCCVDSCNDCLYLCKEKCNLFNEMEKIYQLSDSDFGVFITNLMLYQPEIGKVNNLVSDNLQTRMLLEMVKDVNVFKIDEKNLIRANLKLKEYRLAVEDCADVHMLADRLNKNFDHIEFFRETETLVTDRVNDNLLYGMDNISSPNQNTYDVVSTVKIGAEIDDSESFIKTKTIRVIDEKTARGELIERDN